MSLSDGPCKASSQDYCCPLPLASDGNERTLLIADRFNRRVSMSAVGAAKLSTVGTADFLVNDYILIWGCPKPIQTDNGRQFC